MVRVTTLVITFISKILKKLGRSFSGPLLSSCSVKLHVAMVGTSSAGQPLTRLSDLEYSSLLVYIADQAVADSVVVLSDVAEEPVGKVFLLTQAGPEVGYSEAHVQLALQYYYKLAPWRSRGSTLRTCWKG